MRDIGRSFAEHGRRSIVFFAALTIAFWFAVPLDAEPVRNRILNDVNYTVEAGVITIDVEFSFPVRYLRHFPQDSGDTLQVRLGILGVSDVDRVLLLSRESARIPHELSLPILDLSYEGDLPGGPYLTIRFTEPMQFSVQQGVDFRSLTIKVKMSDNEQE
jgi:hypothetical protein